MPIYTFTLCAGQWCGCGMGCNAQKRLSCCHWAFWPFSAAAIDIKCRMQPALSLSPLSVPRLVLRVHLLSFDGRRLVDFFSLSLSFSSALSYPILQCVIIRHRPAALNCLIGGDCDRSRTAKHHQLKEHHHQQHQHQHHRQQQQQQQQQHPKHRNWFFSTVAVSVVAPLASATHNSVQYFSPFHSTVISNHWTCSTHQLSASYVAHRLIRVFNRLQQFDFNLITCVHFRLAALLSR